MGKAPSVRELFRKAGILYRASIFRDLFSELLLTAFTGRKNVFEFETKFRINS